MTELEMFPLCAESTCPGCGETVKRSYAVMASEDPDDELGRLRTDPTECHMGFECEDCDVEWAVRVWNIPKELP